MKNNNKQSKTQKNIDGIVKSEEIIGTKEDSQAIVETVAKVETKSEKVTPKTTTKVKKTKKSGFLGKTLAELRLVEWPTAKYVAGWSLTIVLFTGLIGSVMGFTDYYFESGIQFIDCTSPNGSKNKSTQDCLKDLTTSLTFQKYFSREAATTVQNQAANTTSADTNAAITTPVTQPTITAEPQSSTPVTEQSVTDKPTTETK